MFARIELFFQSPLWDMIEGAAIIIGLTIVVVCALCKKR